jgi:hypothetical protein
MDNVWKLLIRAIEPPLLMDAALTVAESQWLMAGDDTQDKNEWVDERATKLFRDLKSEVFD